MSTFTLPLVLIFGAIFYMFIFWRRLKEDYESHHIFFTSIISFAFAIIAALATNYFLAPRITPTIILYSPGLWFWGAFIGTLLAGLFSIKKFKLKAIETLEAATPGFLFTLSLIFLIHQEYITTGVLLFHIIIFFLLSARYKKFIWYKSGKIGFAGLITLGSFFLIRAAVAVRFPTMLSLAGKADAIASAAIAFLLFFTLYNLAELDLK